SAGAAHFGAEVTVTTTDGRRLVKVVDSALGRTSEQPLSRFALEAKYRDCAGRVLTPDAVDRSLDLVATWKRSTARPCLPTHWPRDAPAIRRADLPPWRGQADSFLTSVCAP